MTTGDKVVIIVLLVLAFIFGLACGMTMKILGVDAHEHEETSTLSREDIEGGGMPCMLIDDQPKVKGARVEQETSEKVEESTSVVSVVSNNKLQTYISAVEEDRTCAESKEVSTEAESQKEGMVLNEQKTSEEVLEELVHVTERVQIGQEEIIEYATSQPNSEVDTEVDKSVQSKMGGEAPLYTVNGAMLSEALQVYAYQVCQQFGIEWYYPHLLCQMYQESRFDQSAISPHGDYGLMQLKGIYHEHFKQLAGLPNADLINDPYANIYVGVYLMQMYLNQCYDLNRAISTYNTGTFSSYNEAYVMQVRQWESTLRRIA